MTMPIHKHLHELLKEDQEPFHLKNYIADWRCQLNKHPQPKPKSILQIKKDNPIIQTSPKSKFSLCKHACFLSFHDVTKSQFSDFISQPEGQGTTQTGSVFLQVPARTSALLLEAAMRIQKQQQSKPRAQRKYIGAWLFSSLLRKLKDLNREKKSEIRGNELNKSRNGEMKVEESMEVDAQLFSRSCNFSRINSEGWSESNEWRRSLDMETSTSSWRSENSGEIDFVVRKGECRARSPSRKRFCSSPLSPFRFSPQKSTSPGRRSPVLSSPVASPSRRKEQENVEANSLEKNKIEEKEQSSPISVLDPAFEKEEEDRSLGDYDVECNFTTLIKAKEQLLYKLRRFEKLANLDPVELEKRMMAQLNHGEETESLDDEEAGCLELQRSSVPVNMVQESQFQLRRRKVPTDVEAIVSENGDMLLGRVCRKMDCWAEGITSAIDMIVQMDFTDELNQWKRCQEQREETVMEIELAVFGLLVEELAEDLVENS